MDSREREALNTENSEHDLLHESESYEAYDQAIDDQEIADRSKRGLGTAIGALVVLALVGVLAYVAWERLTDDDYQGDLAEFCARVVSDSQSEEVSYYESLVDVAPRDIRATVTRLQDATRDLIELREGEDIAAYFAAAFDPEQQTAERELENYANDECQLGDVCDIARPAFFCQ